MIINRTFYYTLFPENESQPVPMHIVEDMMVENLEQFRLLLSVENSLAGIDTNNTATVFIVDSNGECLYAHNF